MYTIVLLDSRHSLIVRCLCDFPHQMDNSPNGQLVLMEDEPTTERASEPRRSSLYSTSAGDGGEAILNNPHDGWRDYG